MQLEPRLSDEIIPDLNNIVRAIEDEGDRCYLSSTNDADRLREIANWLDTKFRRTPPASQSGEALVELQQGKDELRRLMQVIWQQEYRKEAPDWRPLADLVGMVTQIDNMYAGVRQQRDKALHELASARAEGRREGIEEAAVRDIVAERERQKAVEGWTSEHDDEHNRGELAEAAACYAYGEIIDTQTGCHLWPWGDDDWRPSDRRRELVKAGALILAEIERLDRLTSPPTGRRTDG